jgi:hypothetical protein
MKIIICIFVLCCIGFTACSDTANSPDNTNGGFKPPTTYYYKIDGVSNSVSNDAPKVSLFTCDTRLAKSFILSGDNVQANLHLVPANTSTIGNTVMNDSSKFLYISNRVNPNNNDSVAFYLQLVNTQGVYELMSSSGKIYVSKKNGILRLTTDGKITVTGQNTQSPFDSRTHTVEFSFENGIPF